MVRAPSIRGRPTPQKKHKSTLTSSPSGEKGSSSILPQRTTAITKSLKRAEKRAQLLSRTTQAANTGIRADGEPLSKSALRRRKRKSRDELAKDDQEGRQGGISDLKDAMDELDEELQLEDEEDEDVEGGEYSVGPLAANVVKGGRVTTNHRKKVLQQEQARQKAILSNPTFQKSPFAALREHARNSMVQPPARSR
ncbi:uncharacterized protein FA14DRAFT_155614 [Meira miltonrushii]|uniref:Ribosome biogenesis protein SLX9 n=1 Tax=Meira miltonrushii TaxID=1280837 RepID=A0A316VF99_9BASI|nr:uncharacterized protein FA14DRAFT_155614 [Meira miltonrushii]PWN36210.1 hypothetical protein FA14DRAFT_155614 [Meira miltonrushii]